MFKLISGLLAGAVVLAPMLPAHADYGYRPYRSTGFGVSIGTPSGFGFSVGTPFYGVPNLPYRNQVILRSTVNDPYYPYAPGIVSPGFYSNGFPSSTVIVAPRVRTVIINPGYNNYRSNCGSVIYGSPIASPIPVDPYTGLACR